MYLIRTFETNNKHLLSLNIKRRKMKITQIRENGDTEALSVTDIDLLIEKMKKETKLRPVTGLRQALHFVLPDEPCSLANKLPRVIPAAAFERVNGVKRMKTYNGIVELTIGPLAGKTEVEIVKQKAAELPQTMLAFMGASGKSVKIWTCFTRPDGTLPQTTEEAEVFQAHAYRLAIKCYQPQLPFNILLKEPKLEQFSRLSYDPDLIYRPTPVPFYLSQPIGMPGEMTYHEKSSTEASPLNRALPGLTLALDEVDQFEDVMKTAEKAIRNFINEEPVGYKIYEMEHPDVLLWAVWALQQYAKETSREQCRQKYGELLKDIMEFIRQRKHENLFLHDNGLLFANGTDKAITWMNSTVNGHPVIPRTGYIVEFNALWYNALRFIADLLREGGDVYLADELDAQAEVTGKSFVEVFRNEYGYLLDYVDGNMMDWSVRPNMIFTVAFDYSPLDRAQKKQVLDIVTKELLTPKGIRSLSPKSGGYNPNYVGPQIQRDYAYHQGTAWPWLMGFYLEAYLRIYKMSGLSFVERQLISYDDEMTSHCVGSIPELFDGNPPFKGRGAVSFAMNVAEILRVLKLLSKYY